MRFNEAGTCLRQSTFDPSSGGFLSVTVNFDIVFNVDRDVTIADIYVIDADSDVIASSVAEFDHSGIKTIQNLFCSN